MVGAEGVLLAPDAVRAAAASAGAPACRAGRAAVRSALDRRSRFDRDEPVLEFRRIGYAQCHVVVERLIDQVGQRGVNCRGIALRSGGKLNGGSRAGSRPESA